MKKLVMMLVLVMAVVSAKAAYVDWTVTGAAAQENYTVYLLASAPGDYADVSELAAAAVGSAKIVKSGRAYGTGSQQAIGDAITKDATFYYAIVSGDDAKSFNYVEAAGLAGKVYDPSAQESSPGNFNSITAAQIAAGMKQDFGGGGDVPEPTSGLLLVVGGAMLALRRKQK